MFVWSWWPGVIVNCKDYNSSPVSRPEQLKPLSHSLDGSPVTWYLCWNEPTSLIHEGDDIQGEWEWEPKTLDYTDEICKGLHHFWLFFAFLLRVRWEHWYHSYARYAQYETGASRLGFDMHKTAKSGCLQLSKHVYQHLSFIQSILFFQL